MILRVRERINGRIAGCWGWSSAPELTAIKKKILNAQFTENAGRTERKEADGRGKPRHYNGLRAVKLD